MPLIPVASSGGAPAGRGRTVGRPDFILTIEGLQGESHSATQENDIDISGYSWDAESHRDRATGMVAGKASASDFEFTMRTNIASAFLLGALVRNTRFPKATLTCRKAGPRSRDEIYLKYILEDVYVSKFRSTGGSDDGAALSDNALPIDRFSLIYAKITMEYRRQNPDGSLGGTVVREWDLGRNEASSR
jgi:type VI secretion system secreted protein Hcp